MPSTYTHSNFGGKVFENLSSDVKKKIENNKELFLIGLHGPDIFFYYNPLSKNYINQTGYGMHGEIAANFFSGLRDKANNNDSLAAYLFGFICHFMLDSSCHGYIAEKMEKSNISHAEIEVEFDRSLLVADNKNPLTASLTDHIVVNDPICEVISIAFPSIPKSKIEKSLKSFIHFNRILIAPGKLKRNFILTLLKISGNYDSMKGLLINYTPNPNCADSCIELQRRFDNAVIPTTEIITEYDRYISDNNRQLSERFNRNYE